MSTADPDQDELARRYGIQRRYLDNADQPAELDDATVTALRNAIGEADQAGPVPLVIRPDG